MGFGIETAGWFKKVALVKSAFDAGSETAVKKGSDIILKAAIKNLSGPQHREGTPSPTPGQLPVSRIASHLKQSMRREMVAKDLALVFPDVTMSPYAAAVHDGNKRGMKPRRYLSQAVIDNRDKCKAVIKESVMESIWKYGLS